MAISLRASVCEQDGGQPLPAHHARVHGPAGKS